MINPRPAPRRQATGVALAVSLLCGVVPIAKGALVWTNLSGLRAAAVTPTGSGQAGFTSLAPEATGLTFTNVVPVTRHYTNQILLNGSGVAAGDWDGDGWCDLVFCGLAGRTTIYRNLGGWKFANITIASGVDLTKVDATGIVAADLEGDADLDLIINTVGQGTLVFLNQGAARFTRVTPFLNAGRCGSSSALADIDGDGDLDLYVANYRINTMRDEPHLTFTIKGDRTKPRVTAYGDRPITAPDLLKRFRFHDEPTPNGGATVFHDERGEPDGFFRNLGDGRFAPISFTNGVFLNEIGAVLTEEPLDWGLAVMFRDLNRDGAPDLYVGNDFNTPDRIWINDGQGRFRPLAPQAIRQTSFSTMAVDVADLDRDGHDEIFTADMLSVERWRRQVQVNQVNPNMHFFEDVVTRAQTPRNTLQHNRGDGTYAEIAQMAGLEASEWSWASIFLDVDLDGYEDLLVANGFERDFMNMDAQRRVRAAQAQVPRGQPPGVRLAAVRFYPRLATANLAFRNLGSLRFAETGTAWGFDGAAVSQGMCLADLDNDGDLDVALNNLNGPASLLRNESTAPRLAIRLRGNSPNTRGIGARLRIEGGPVAAQTQEMISGGRYLSSDDALRVFAAGSLTNRLMLEIQWRSGARSRLTNLPPNYVYEVAETSAVAPAPLLKKDLPILAPLFKDVSSLLGHSQPPAPADDADDQPLLPFQLEAFGAGLSWLDLNGDGWDDLILPGTKGESLAIYHNRDGKGFARQPYPAAGASPPATASSTVGWRETTGEVVLLSGLGGDRSHTNHAIVQQRRFQGSEIKTSTPLPISTNAVGPLALADIDGDGDLDLFVGGRFVPGRWPEPATSALYRHEGGQWFQDAVHSNLFQQAGLVRAALFTDLDQDHDPDLVLACEWGPIRVFTNERGRFRTADWKITFAPGNQPPSEARTLEQLTGWWTGVSSGDFDGDGQLDLVAGNWGRNTKYERLRSRPLRVYFGDVSGNGSAGIVESWFDPALGKYTPLHDVWTLSRTMPWLLTRFHSYESFARVGMEEALGDYFSRAHYREAAWLDSSVFLNRGDHFEIHSLPALAQVAPAFGVCVTDFNNDGHEDIFLAQNFFAVRLHTSRYDAGRGLLLQGNGQGSFRPVSGSESGLEIYGEQRGAAVCDYDHDGRIDLAVGQLGEATRLYHNETAPPGLRVRLQGNPGNPQAIGAQLRLRSGTSWGPVREVHAGSGYWSQNSAVEILAPASIATELQVRWPGGKSVDVPIKAGVREMLVRQQVLK